MKTKNELIEKYTFLIKKEVKQNRLYGEINRYKRIIEIIQGINPTERKNTLKMKL